MRSSEPNMTALQLTSATFRGTDRTAYHCSCLEVRPVQVTSPYCYGSSSGEQNTELLTFACQDSYSCDGYVQRLDSARLVHVQQQNLWFNCCAVLKQCPFALGIINMQSLNHALSMNRRLFYVFMMTAKVTSMLVN